MQKCVLQWTPLLLTGEAPTSGAGPVKAMVSCNVSLSFSKGIVPSFFTSTLNSFFPSSAALTLSPQHRFEGYNRRSLAGDVSLLARPKMLE